MHSLHEFMSAREHDILEDKCGRVVGEDLLNNGIWQPLEFVCTDAALAQRAVQGARFEGGGPRFPAAETFAEEGPDLRSGHRELSLDAELDRRHAQVCR